MARGVSTIVGIEHVNYTKDGKLKDYHIIHYAADPHDDDVVMNGQYCKTARCDFDCSDIEPGIRARLIFEQDPKWNRSTLVEIIPV